ncbi:hypothetical protein N7495_009595 [Penicillium taxi]|uniref:uncharacterized protein n=1 Tax=Penicillium taxi TaxID=168475 RepID=UPI00254584CD|nr:uncharacterized protein N7495_009595 [Penicillium taxi]KAJ5885085.1 hypothetical protein N7495_009595 [Penicillium taxi]
MRVTIHALLSVFATVATVTALPSPEKREILAYRAWDFRLYSAGTPTCEVNDSNIDITVLHRYGASSRDCQALLDDISNGTTVKSLAWKSPSEDDEYDLCLFRTADCSGGSSSLIASITDGWEVCYPYSGWLGWKVVSHGGSCV